MAQPSTGIVSALRPSRLGRDPHEGRDNACARANAAGQASRHLRVAAAAATIIDRNLQDAQPRAGGAHLHLDIPAVAQLAHAKREQGIAPDRAKRAHVGVANAIKEPHAPAGQAPGRELVPGDAAGLALAARARSDDEIAMPGADRLDQPGDRLRIVGAVAVHEHHDIGVLGRHGRCQAGAAVAAPGVDDVGARILGTRRGGIACCRRPPR